MNDLRSGDAEPRMKFSGEMMMDQHGRLHMPGFVGGTFDETGLTNSIPRTETRPAAVAPVSRQVRRALERAAVKRGGQQDRRQGVKA